MNKPKIILTVGAAGSGKTTWAENYVIDRMVENKDAKWSNLNRDEVRFELFCDGKRDWTKYKFKKANENKVTEIIGLKTHFALKHKVNIIVSDTNLNTAFRDNWRQVALDNGYDYEEVSFEVPWTELVKRNIQREGGIDTKVLRQQFLRMEEYLGRKTYTPDTSKPKAVIVDVDGTVADMEGIRKPYEWHKVKNDRPREMVLAMVNGLANNGHKIIFLSGRDGACHDDTFDWLRSRFGNFEKLLMREADDMRKDFIIKEELFWLVADEYNIVGAIDDRHQVLRLWEELGIENVINVNRGVYNEF
jgi:tRNA uridine 5-carbamoylmethylation protein Kti12